MLRQAPEARKAAGAEAKRYKMGSFSSTSPSPAHSTSTIHRSSIPSGDDSSTNMTGSSLDHDMDAGGGGAHSNESPNGLRVIADESKRLTQLVTRIRELGVEETGLALPKLCVVGGQSTGKSSLIEAIRYRSELLSAMCSPNTSTVRYVYLVLTIPALAAHSKSTCRALNLRKVAGYAASALSERTITTIPEADRRETLSDHGLARAFGIPSLLRHYMTKRRWKMFSEGRNWLR